MKDENISLDKMGRNIEGINRNILLFQERVTSIPSELSRDFNNTLRDLKLKRDKYVEKFQKLTYSSMNAYEDMEIGTKMAWEDLNTAFESAKERFEKFQ